MADLLESVSDNVAVVTLNRPERLNALSAEMVDLLIAALRRLGADPGVGAIVLTGAGRGFCAGGDVKAMAERGDPGSNPGLEQRVHDLQSKHQVIVLLRSVPKVVIGAINGPAFGAGLGIAMACDLRIAALGAQFGTAFVKVGFSGDFGGSYHLTQLVGAAKARELYILGEQIDAEQAHALGLVTRVVPDEALMDEAMGLARRIAAGPQLAYGYMKRNLLAAETAPLQEILDLEALHQARTGMTEDHREAARAFVEKRPPTFRGR